MDGECSAATDAGRRPRRSQPSTPRPRPPLSSSILLIRYFSCPLPRLAANASSGLRPSATSNLFPGMYRLAATIELAPWKIAPMFSVAAPRYWARRSVTGAKGRLWKSPRQRRCWPLGRSSLFFVRGPACPWPPRPPRLGRRRRQAPIQLLPVDHPPPASDLVQPQPHLTHPTDHCRLAFPPPLRLLT